MHLSSRILEAAGRARPGRLTRARSWWEQEHVYGYGLILPALVLIIGLVAYPFCMAILSLLSSVATILHCAK